jgi:hypothetical protein
MDLVLRNLIGHEAWVFINDILIYSDLLEEHVKRLANVFERFKKANLQLQPEKCAFAKDKVTYLGFENVY